MSITTADENTNASTAPDDGAQPPVGDGTGVAGDHRAEKDKNRKKLIWIFSIIGVAILLVISLFAWYLITRKPLTALPGISTDSVPHFGYAIYGVTEPLGVAVTSDGSRIYVTESGGTHALKEFNRDGKLVDTLVPPAATGKGHVPLYVAIDPTSGNVFESDRFTSAIYVFDTTGHYVRTFKPIGLSGKWVPLGLAFDASGRLYVTEALAKTSRIMVFDKSGTLQRTIKTPDPMSYPNGIAVSGNGTVAVTDSNNGRALIFDSNGNLITAISGGMAPADLGLPRGITFDSQGRIDIVDTTNQGVRVYKLSGSTVKFVGVYGDQGIADGLFMYPNGISADSRARLYVTDRVNNRVQVWSY